MLKKILHTIFAFFLLMATTGISLSMHYCGGKLASISINHEAKSCCDMTGGCCENETISFEVEKDFISPVYAENSKIAERDILFPILVILSFELLPEGENSYVVYTDSSPPPTIRTRLSLLQTYLC
jgi:hypothetical protein